MKEIKYVLTDELGLHARPAGQLVKVAAAFKSEIQLGTAAKMVNAKRIMGVMGLALKKNDEMIITMSGEDEDAACAGIEAFLKESL